MASPKPIIAFYGATGGCTLGALVPALKAGYDCTARKSSDFSTGFPQS